MPAKLKDKSRDVSPPISSRSTKEEHIFHLWTWRPLVLLTTLIALLAFAAIVWSSVKLQVESQGCAMSYMSPTYLGLSGFDSEHSRFASKYSLYLYREEGVDEYTEHNLGLRGAPVLFIPGNAGSYKQVRSISSEASRYYHNELRNSQQAQENGVRALDFFTLDFNEDLAAFHGQTVLDQAEYVNEAITYILSLYHDSKRSRREPSLPDPSSVILLGHSMGGIVARAALVDSKYQDNSVNTIITMATPHARPPVSFDADIVALYEKINAFWRRSYTGHGNVDNALDQVTLVSIAGGGRDTTVPSDYASVSSLAPESHGLTVFTSGIPNIWTSMDHLAITWSDQMRRVLVRALYEIVDIRKTSQVKPRSSRMRTFRKWFLTGLEDSAPKHLMSQNHDVLLTLGKEPRTTFAKGDDMKITQLGAQDFSSVKLLSIPPPSNQTLAQFQLLTNQPTGLGGVFEHIDILFCSSPPSTSYVTNNFLPNNIDFSDGESNTTRLICDRPNRDNIVLPASTKHSRNAFDSAPTFTYLQYDLRDLQKYQFLAVVDRSTEISDGWLYASTSARNTSTANVDTTLSRLLLTGAVVRFPYSKALMHTVHVPVMSSSLLAYKLSIRRRGHEQSTEMFTPLVRQYIDGPHESKYFVNFEHADINLHGIAPFMPPNLPGQPEQSSVSFQIWSDPTSNQNVEFKFQPDLAGSMGKLVIRYRTVFAAFPLLVVAMVLRKQFRIYDNTGIFISFDDSLSQSLKLALPVMLLSMTLFATAFSNTPPAQAISGSLRHNITIDYGSNDLLLGSQDSFFWFLVPLAGLLSVAACVLLNYIVTGLVQMFAAGIGLFSKIRSQRQPGEAVQEVQFSTPMAMKTRRRLINTAVLLLLVSTVVPYPFAYLVACLVQLANTTQALHNASVQASTDTTNFFHYTHSILILMLWVLPINIPVLVVWIHNLTVHWMTPFSSHHNILSIAPFIFLVETVSNGSMVPALSRFRWATNILFFVLAVYSAVYGMTYAYRLHYIANIIALWLVLLHWSARKVVKPKVQNNQHGRKSSIKI